MSAINGLAGFLPWLGLILTILYFRASRPFFAAIAWGASAWSLATTLETNCLSWLTLLASGPILLFWLLYCAVFAALIRPRLRRIHWHPDFSAACLCFYFILAITLLLALAYAPSFHDSLAYHLPRILHWLQNGSLAPYPTSIDRQIGMAPLNGWIMLQAMAISHSDWLVNLPQWLSFAGTICGVMAITATLGYGRPQQLIAGFFFCTLPIAIMQSGNSESSLLATFWLCVFTWAFLSFWQKPNWADAILLGLALGFAILAKGVAYPVALPFVACIAWQCLRNFRNNILYGITAAVIIIGLNAPHLYRNQVATNSPVLSAERNIIYKPSPALFTVNAFYHFLLQEPWLVALMPKQQWSALAARLGVDDHDPQLFPWRGIEAGRASMTPSDIDGQSPAHAFLILLIVPFLIWKRQKGTGLYLTLFCVSFAFFCAFLTWQPWAARLHLPWFMLAAPLAGIALMDLASRPLRASVLAVLGATAFMPLFFCLEHPLGPASWLSDYRENIGHFLTSSRDEQYFNLWRKTRQPYMAAVEFLAAQKPASIGLDLADDGLEYPVWGMLAKRLDKMPKIMHTPAPYPANGPDYIFKQHHSSFSELLDPVVFAKTPNGYQQVFPEP